MPLAYGVHVISCVACGVALELPQARGFSYVREPDGRASYQQAGIVIHNCAQGSYVTSERRAARSQDVWL